MRTADNLLFHAVVEDDRETPPGWIPVSRLGGLLEELLSHDLLPRPLSDYLVDALRPGFGGFTVSFDDAHPSVLHLAAPILRELRIPATLFVPTAYVGETDLVMDWEDLRALEHEFGWTLGSHGAVHQRSSWRLHDEDERAHFDRLLADARFSRRALEDHLGISADLYAYPFGEAARAARRAVASAGYRAAFTVAQNAEWDGDLHAIPRRDPTVPAPGPVPDPPPGISVVVPAFNRLPLLAEVVRRLHAQTYPADRYEVIVVDDGSTEDLGSCLDASTRVLRLEDSDGTFRAGQARQAGAEAARFDLLAFLDADVAVDEDFLWHLAWCHRQHRDAVVLGYLSGYNLHDLGHVHRLDDIRGADRLTGDVVPVVPDRSREPVLRACLDNMQVLDDAWTLCYTGNFSVGKDLLRRAGGFASDFSGWGLEDIDLGCRLHREGARWFFSRWALGYHLADSGQAGAVPSNPFRHPRPSPEGFSGLLRNLATLEARHASRPEVLSWCRRLRSDIDEHLDPPGTIGVECGAGYPFPWPFRRLHRAAPGGTPAMEIRDRLAYARKLGVRRLYLLGGDVILRPDLDELLEEATRLGAERITLETTALTLTPPRAAAISERGLTGATVEVLAGCGHPDPAHAGRVAAGVDSLRAAGIRLGAKLVLGVDDRNALRTAATFLGELDLSFDSVHLLVPGSEDWIRDEVGDDVDVQIG